MWRHFLVILFAAAVGCLTATLIWATLIGAISPDEIKGLLGFSLMSMFFALPGAAMLLGLSAVLVNRGWPELSSNLLVLLVGALAGTVSLSLITGYNMQWSATGGLFAFATGTTVLIIKRLWAGMPHLKPVAGWLWTIFGASLLALVTLAMTPI
jgi:hypothetical protein